MSKENAVGNSHPYQDKLYRTLDVWWDKVPSSLTTIVATTIIFLAGISIRGDWLLIFVLLIKQFSNATKPVRLSHRSENSDFSHELDLLENFRWCMISSVVFSLITYFALCGFLQWYFYIRRRDRPEDWKCQPKKFLTWENEKHEILLGTFGIVLGSVTSGVLSFYINCGGYNTLYYRLDEYGWIYLVFSIPATFLLIDGFFYHYHRLFHLPVLYKTFHKVHHRYKQPTAFSSTALHPIDFLFLQALILSPIFIIPVHWAVYLVVNLYCFYYGILDHSGVKLESIWPWQPNTTFHDNHHQYFHTNFGFNTKLWDWLYGTLREEDKIYSENIFYGFGKRWDEASEEERNSYITQHGGVKTS